MDLVSLGRPNILHEHLAWLVGPLEWVAAGILLGAILILLAGTARFLLGGVRAELSRDNSDRVRRTNAERVELGRYILSALELFIVADLLHTALSQELGDLIYLGVLVLIRSAISYFLDRELAALKKDLGE
ncbi:MAG: DUF1622 domain-containing protein [Cereibacter changlensis]